MTREETAFFRCEQRRVKEWRAEKPCTKAGRQYGTLNIASERVQGFSAGWRAGVAWAKREALR